MDLISLDLTAELAPIIWTMETFMLVAVVWLVAMFFADQMRTASGQHKSDLGASREPNKPTNHEDRIAA